MPTGRSDGVHSPPLNYILWLFNNAWGDDKGGRLLVVIFYGG